MMCGSLKVQFECNRELMLKASLSLEHFTSFALWDEKRTDTVFEISFFVYLFEQCLVRKRACSFGLHQRISK